MSHATRLSIRFAMCVLSMTLCSILPPAFAAADGSGDEARELARTILSRAGVRGGLVVHLGCGDGKLTAGLRASGRYAVHGLERDPELVRAAREHVAALGLEESVLIERWDGAALPHADGLINLVVLEERAAGSISPAEILRVLVPRGAACSRKGEGWETSVKPWPGSIDEWSHYLHDAGNNAVARDTVVGPPRSLRWVAPPLWLRSHETPSGVQALVSAGGRLFYIFDEGLIGITDQRLPERWSLVCRDAFNGKLLWKKDVEPWGWPEWASAKFADADWTTIRGGRTVVPDENQRRLVAEGDRLYATLGFSAPLSILDASSGEILATVEETAPVTEILASAGTVLVHSRDASAAAARRRGEKPQSASRLIAVNGSTGEVLWKKEVGSVQPLSLSIDAGRVVYQDGQVLTCLQLASGDAVWKAGGLKGRPRTVIAHDGLVLVYLQKTLQAYSGEDGRPLWSREVPSSSGGEGPDLFIVGGLVYRGMVPIDGEAKPVGKSADAMAVAYDLRTGEEKKRIVVRGLRSPEHHHRCYRNKATLRYIISGMEGAEYMDLEGGGHGQNNWLRGACKLGVMPCNGLLYAPPDQCFCQPGAKLLGFLALAGEDPSRGRPAPDDRRLERGEAYGAISLQDEPASPDDWPTHRRDPARHGSTSTKVPAKIAPLWRAALGGRLTAPVAVGDRIYAARCDARTVHALDRDSGRQVWKFAADGRIDSPPTIHRSLVLVGAADGRVYCLRASDGALVWRFLAAPADRRIACFDQIESVWPVHGSVLVRDGIAYAAAGRSTYLDGGIRVYGLDPLTGDVRHRTTIEGPFPGLQEERDAAFYLLGANSDVLVSEGDHIYMRQKKLTPDLREVEIPVLSSKGAQDVGLHVFSTSGLLDGSWYNRTFWMYSRRWPGFQLAQQAPKSGQLLVVDDDHTFGVKVFYRRNVHSLMFFPGREGYLLFADHNSTEPQIVGEEGARKPLEWLPQSHIPREGEWGLDSQAFGLDKMIGYTRADPPVWARWVPIRVRAMVKAADLLFVAGPPDELDPADPYASFEGRRGARLAVLSAADGAVVAERPLDVPPVFDGLIAAGGRLYASLEDGSVLCLARDAGGERRD